MLSPSVMMIESAVDTFKNLPDWIRQSQQKELTSFGDERAKQFGANNGLSDDLRKGYELGLQTARVVIMGSMAINMKGVKPEDVL